jgi:hypothetical protein
MLIGASLAACNQNKAEENTANDMMTTDNYAVPADNMMAKDMNLANDMNMTANETNTTGNTTETNSAGNTY